MTTQNPVHFIAEAGCNHNGDLDVAMRMADASLAGGASSFKVQLTYPDAFLLPVLEDGVSTNPGYVSRGEITLSENHHRDLAAYCKEIGIPFSASAFDEAGVDMLVDVGAPYVKISSGDLTYTRLLQHAASSGLKVILSTGMAELREIEQALDVLVQNGAKAPVLMHCVSAYPCPVERMNLGMIDVLKSQFGMPVGLSDHSKSDMPVIAAVAKGATWIEKHFTLDRTQQGVDHALSLEPEDLSRLVTAIRMTQAACAPHDQKVGEEERRVRQRARRGLYAARDLEEGCMLTPDDILIVRPESEVAPADAERLLGTQLKRSLKRYAPFIADDL